MKERERIVVGGLLVLLLGTWLGFFFHRSPRFAGSPWGVVLGVLAAILMLVPLLYLVVKRFEPLRRWTIKRIRMRTLLSWHIYAGIVGPILALLHTGHRFESPLGIALTALTLVVVVSGFIGRYLMGFLGQELKGLRETLAGLRQEYESVAGEGFDVEGAKLTDLFGLRITSLIGTAPLARSPQVRAAELVTAIADTEYAIASNETFKRAFAIWLAAHIVLSLVLYALLALHVFSGLYFGLGWLT